MRLVVTNRLPEVLTVAVTLVLVVLSIGLAWHSHAAASAEEAGLVKRVDVIGAVDMPDVAFTAVRAVLLRQEVTPAALEEAELRATAACYDHGFLDARVAIGLARGAGGGVVAVLTVVEGPRYQLGRVETGDRFFDMALEGQLFRRVEIVDHVHRIAARYREEGHAFATVLPRTRVAPDTHLVDLTLEIEPGPLVTLESVLVVGDLDGAAARRLQLRPGERYRQSRIEAAVDQLRRSGRYDEVELSMEQGSRDDRIRLNIDLRPRAGAPG